MKIAFFETEEWEEIYLRGRLGGHELLFFEDELDFNLSKSVSDVDVISVFIYSELSSKVLGNFKKLRAIVTRSTGFDHIDMKCVKRKGIKILNVPSYGENTVAEHTFALILALSRKIHTSYGRTIRGNFSLEGLQGFDLKGKTIGIIGLGNIGRHVARIAHGFEMNILVSTPRRDVAFGKRFGLKYVNLDKVLKNSDIISLHCPLNKKTKHLINEKNFKMIKEGAFLINTSRGGLIETRALVRTLVDKKIGGAALDVLEEESLIREEAQLLSKNFPKDHLENLIENHLLLTFDNVIITPHNAFNSKEAIERILDTSVENIQELFKGGKLSNIVK